MTSSQVQEPLRWFFGDLLERRLEYESAHGEVLWSRLARALISGGKTAEFWRQWVAAYRAALTNPDEGPFKVAEDLQIDSSDFTAKLMDVFAEIAAAVHLSRQGAVRFQPIPRSALKTPDFVCEWGGVETAVEVKNLRAHDFIEEVMLDLYLDAGLKSGDKPQRTLVMQRSDRGWLSKNEIAELRELVQRLPEHAVGQVHAGTLHSGKALAFRLEQEGDSRSEDAISVNDLERDLAFREGFVKKVTRVATDALDQLLSASVARVDRRVVAMRWDIPWYALLQPADLPDTVRGAIASALSGTPHPIEALFFHDFGEPLTVYRPQ
jgi:hypothetical protein